LVQEGIFFYRILPTTDQAFLALAGIEDLGAGFPVDLFDPGVGFEADMKNIC